MRVRRRRRENDCPRDEREREQQNKGATHDGRPTKAKSRGRHQRGKMNKYYRRRIKKKMKTNDWAELIS